MQAERSDYFRFTVGGLVHVLRRNGFHHVTVEPLIGTLGAGLNLRQKLLSSWLSSRGLGAVAGAANALLNLRILAEDRLCPDYAASLAPIAIACVARPR